MSTVIEPLKVHGALLIKPKVYVDERGYFYETHRTGVLSEAAGMDIIFTQGNESSSVAWTIRGLHYQNPRPQGKLMHCPEGSAWIVGVDLRELSPSFGRNFVIQCSRENLHQVWLPPGLAAGFLAGPRGAIVSYACSGNTYDDDAGHVLKWSDGAHGVRWPIPEGIVPVVSAKDRSPQSTRTWEHCLKYSGTMEKP